MNHTAAIGVFVAVLFAGCGGTTATTVPPTAPATASTTATTPTVATTTTTTAAVTSQPETTTTTVAVAAADVAIVGDDEFVTQASAALDLLENEVPDTYAEVLTHISTIESVTAGSGMDVFTKTFRVGEVTAYAPGYGPEDQVLWLAGTIVHDACHSRLYTDGEEYIGRDAELACLIDQLAALETMSGSAFESYLSFLIEGVDDPANDYSNDPNRHW